jgi:O-antigen/teichoic acid export membrane protein
MRKVKALVWGYAGLSLLTVIAIVLMRNHPKLVTDAVWTRAIIVAASSLLTLRFTVGAGRGSSRHFLRLRIVTAVMLVAIIVIVALPGAFPVWLRAEQAVCGVLLLGVVALVNGPALRSVRSKASV